MTLKIWGQEAPNDLLQWQVPAIGSQGATELGEQVLVRSSCSKESGQVAKSVLGLGVGGSLLPGNLGCSVTSVWSPPGVRQHIEHLSPGITDILFAYLLSPPTAPLISTHMHTFEYKHHQSRIFFPLMHS